MSSIFISYRRDDSAPYAGRLYDRLTAHFGAGEVFMDIDQIEPGEDFVEVIERKVGGCETAVVLIGERWLAAADADGARRLDDPADFVRLEVAAALQRGACVVPVLVGGAVMPRPTELPEALAALSRRNAVELSDSRFHRDVDRLIAALSRPVTQRTPAGANRDATTYGNPGRAPVAKPMRVAIGAAGLAGVGVLAWAVSTGRSPSSTTPAHEAAPTAAAAAAPASTTPLATPSAARGDSLDSFRLKERARSSMLTWALLGSADAQYRYAVELECYVPKDAKAAWVWFRKAADQGHARAIAALTALNAPPPDNAAKREAQESKSLHFCTSEMLDSFIRDTSQPIKPAE